MDSIVQSEISQIKTNTVWFHLKVESKNQSKWTKIIKQKNIHRYRKQTGDCQGKAWGMHEVSEGD